MVQQLCPLSQTLVPFNDMAHPAKLTSNTQKMFQTQYKCTHNKGNLQKQLRNVIYPGCASERVNILSQGIKHSCLEMGKVCTITDEVCMHAKDLKLLSLATKIEPCSKEIPFYFVCPYYSPLDQFHTLTSIYGK